MSTQSEQGAASGSGPTLGRTGTSNYVTICSDEGSGAKHDVTFYRPVPPPGYFIVGDYAQGTKIKKPAVGASLVVKPIDEDPKNPLVKPPVDYVLMWSSGPKPKQPFSIWHPVPPDKYVSVGDVTTTGFSKPHVEAYRCIRRDVAGEIHRGSEIWNDGGSGVDVDVQLYKIDEYPNAFIAGIWESYELKFSMKGLLDFEFDVEEHSVGSFKWGGATCETDDTGATMFVRAKRHATPETATWFKDAVGRGGAAIGDMTSSDWPNKLDVAFRGKMSFTHQDRRYEGLDIVIGQGYKAALITHNWWIGGPHMSQAADFSKVLAVIYQTFVVKIKGASLPAAKVQFTGDAGHTNVFHMGILTP
jgi:VPS62-like protein